MKTKKIKKWQPIKKCPNCGSTEFEISLIGWTNGLVDRKGNLHIEEIANDNLEVDIIHCPNCGEDFTRSQFRFIY